MVSASDLNLSSVRSRVIKERPDWTSEYADKVDVEYRRWLQMCSEMDKHNIPELKLFSKHVDDFWHNHVLFTEKYMNECDQIAGRYLHHQPADDNDTSSREADALVFTAYYTKLFGEYPSDIWKMHKTPKCGCSCKCGSANK